MFCQNCGNEMNSAARFCPNCGEKNEAAVIAVSQKETSVSKEYDRDALRIYLGDLRVLEYATSKLDKKVNNTDYRIGRLGQKKEYREPTHDWDEIIKGIGLLFLGGVIIALALRITEYYLGYLFHISIFFAIIFLLWGFGKLFVDWADYGSYKMDYDDAVAADKERVKQEIIEKEELTKLRSEMYDEYIQTKEMLEKMYSVDIIPSQFRNIYAVYYLYEFISTSNESFSAALLHCDLDTIKSQLSTIIEQNREMIINQEIIAAQNENIMSQNQRSLRHLAQTEHNTSMAEKYSQIAANNAEACAWIGVANYIKD